MFQFSKERYGREVTEIALLNVERKIIAEEPVWKFIVSGSASVVNCQVKLSCTTSCSDVISFLEQDIPIHDSLPCALNIILGVNGLKYKEV